MVEGCKTMLIKLFENFFEIFEHMVYYWIFFNVYVSEGRHTFVK